MFLTSIRVYLGWKVREKFPKDQPKGPWGRPNLGFKTSKSVPTNEANQQIVGPLTPHRLGCRLKLRLGSLSSQFFSLWTKPRTRRKVRWWVYRAYMWPSIVDLQFSAGSRPKERYHGYFTWCSKIYLGGLLRVFWVF